VLGDMPEGNAIPGSPFSENGSPNQHAIARNSSCSIILREWESVPMVTIGAWEPMHDYIEKTGLQATETEGSYDSREVVNCNNKTTLDICKEYGVTYRTYGELWTILTEFAGHPGSLALILPAGQKIRDTTRFNHGKGTSISSTVNQVHSSTPSVHK